MTLTLWTRNPPSVRTESGFPDSFKDVGGELEFAGGANDELNPAEADPIDGVDVDDFGIDGGDGPRAEAPTFWLTIICSPWRRPRLDKGSSGTMMSDWGG